MKNNPTTVDDKVTERETKEQIVESSLHHSNKKNDSTPTENNTKNETIVGDSIVQNVPSHSLNKSLKRIFQGCKIVVQQHKI